MTPPLSKYPLPVRLTLMFSMCLFNLGAVSIVAMYIAEKIFGIDSVSEVVSGVFHSNTELYAFLFVQGVVSLGWFALTAVMFSALEAGEVVRHLRIDVFPPVKFLVLTVFAILAVQFFIEYLVETNQKIPLPSFLSFLEKLQQQSKTVTDSVMKMNTLPQLLAVSLVMAVVPAIAEEFFFRGLVLGDLLKAKANPVFSIVFTGFAFAVLHLEFDYTLAIWALGIFLGYLYYISGSLWLPVAAHFANNFLAVQFKYLYNKGIITNDITEAKTPLYITLISLAVFALCIFLFYKWQNRVSFVEETEYNTITENTSNE